MYFRFVDLSWSEHYARNSNSHFQRFARVCALNRWQSMPASEWTLIRYSLFRFFTSQIAGPSLQVELYGIRQVHVRCGLRLEIHRNAMPMLNRVTRTFKKFRPKGFRDKLPITSPVLHRMLSCLKSNDHDNQTYRAILCFAKFGMLRVSEYTSGPCGACPRVGDIRFIPDMASAQMIAYYFRNSKTNQFRHRERVVAICQCPGPCAVHELTRMLSWRKQVTGDQFLFRLKNGKVPSARDVNAVIKRTCTATGLDPRQFSSHGLRAGGVTDLLTMGVPAEVVQVLTRHKNIDSLRPYKKPSDAALGTILCRHSDEWLMQTTALAPGAAGH